MIDIPQSLIPLSYCLVVFQVKEVGIYVSDCPGIAKKVEIYFENLWTLTTLNVSDYTVTVWDAEWQVTRKVPCWSHFVSPESRCR